MPRFDGTGPASAGKMTGWGLGPCRDDSSVVAAGIYGRGMGFRRGMGMRQGMGFGRGYGLCYNRGFEPALRAWTAPAPDMGAAGLKEVLQEKKDFLKTQLEAIDKQLETL